MRIGLIAEGTYPYVTGGVSSWIQTLISNLPEFEFEIYHLRPDSKKREIRYKIPKNVIRIHELNIFGDYDPNIPEEADFSMLSSLTDAILKRQSLKELVLILEDFIRKNAGKSFYRLYSSKEFWEIVTKTYKNFFNHRGFTEYYWIVRNLTLPIINSLQFIPEKCDIFHVPSTGYASLVGIVGKFLYNTPLIITEHGIYHREREREIIISKWLPEDYKPMWINLFRAISMLAYNVCDSLTTLFKKNQLFQLELGANPEKMTIIPNGVDVDKFDIPKEKHEGFIVGFVGRVTRIKDVKTAIRSIRIVKDVLKDEKIKFLIIGPTDEEQDYYEECKKLAKNLFLEDTVEFLGPQNVREYYPKLDVLLLSSVSEGQPLVILEAMAAGVPIVATDVGACKEIVYDEEGQCGIIVPPKNHMIMAKAILKLFEDKEMREVFSENAKKNVRKKYRLDLMIQNYKNLYLHLLKNRLALKT
ncbi:GT4 family glycosyltransferase PelF [Thermotoga sp. SG1]|uniref:GT4 family glycosyltransferase PelF n=1 Tax=Thermotoga sp. SG1 TaxID=126739 RepID=UPI000C78BDE8|nr:GT4 family glycosyltransferase PelF [Thermotoga sp. SG1]PLV55723.1 glycosyl transferase family 1 [Thermotoga sp. SG1]